MSPLPDSALLQAWQAGDQEAFGTLIARHHGVVRAACARQAAPGDCDDCVQAVFLVLVRRPGAAAKAPALVAWLLRTATLVCHHSRRAAEHRRRNEAAAAALAANEHAAPTTAMPAALDHLDACLQRLPEKQRAAVTMHYLAGQDAAEVATALGTSRANAYMLLSRGLTGLRALLAQRGVALGSTALVGLLSGEAQAAIAPQPVGIISSLTSSPTPAAVALAEGVATSMSRPSVLVVAAITTLLSGALLGAALLIPAPRAIAQPAIRSVTPETEIATEITAPTPPTPTQFGPARVAWSCPTAHETPFLPPPPLLAGNHVVFASEHAVLCFTTAGQQLWEQPVQAYLQQPVISGDLVVFAEDDAVHCRQLAGSTVWSQSIACGQGGPSPAISGDRVLMPTRHGAIACFALVDGHPLWTYQSPVAADYRCPTVSGEVFVCNAQQGNDGDIECHALADGTLLWSTAVPGCGAHLAVADGTVYVGSSTSERDEHGFREHGALLALDLASGAIRWRAAQDQRLPGGPALTGDTVVAFGNLQVAAFARIDGALRWSVPRQDFGAGSIAIDRRGWIVLGAEAIAGRLLILDPHDGHQRLSLDVEQLAQEAGAPMGRSSLPSGGTRPTIGGFGPPALGEGRLYLSAANGWLTAIDLPGAVAAAPAY